MKEAAGEANITVITIVLIGVVAAVGLLLVPNLMKKAKARACCTDHAWYVSGNKCCKPGTECSGKDGTTLDAMVKKSTISTDWIAKCMHNKD